MLRSSLLRRFAYVLMMSCASSSFAQTFLGQSTGTLLWSTPANWDGGVPTSGPSTRLFFTGPILTDYTSVNDLPGTFTANRMTFDSAQTDIALSGNPLRFVADGATLPKLVQLRTHRLRVNVPIQLDANLTFEGQGAFVHSALDQIDFNAPISGTGGLTFAPSPDTPLIWMNVANTYQGGTTIQDGNVFGTTGCLGTSNLTVSGDGYFDSREFTHALSGAASVKVLAGGGVYFTSGGNTYTGGTLVQSEPGASGFNFSVIGAGPAALGTGSVTLIHGGLRNYAAGLLDNDFFLTDAVMSLQASDLTVRSLSGTGFLYNGFTTDPTHAYRFTQKFVAGGASATGSVTFEGSSAIFDPGSLVQFELGGTVAGSTYDQAIFTTTQNSDVPHVNGSILQLALINGFVPSPGQTFTLFDIRNLKPVDGTFLNLPQGSVIEANGARFSISYVGGTGNDIVLTTLVPEPGITLCALSLLVLAGRRPSASK